MEDWRMRCICRVGAMHLSWAYYAYRRRLLFHRPDLHRRGVRPHEQALAQRLLLLIGDDQGVLRVARRVIRREVERLEVVVVSLDLGTIGDRVSHRLEDPDDLVHGLDQGMLDANWPGDARQGDVESFRFKL